ncbi:MAG: thioredoxin-dependent thiol peroxidase [Propionibacteriaceae bacterium]|jgi:peroxiredoxin Q/BCP|nr:thioredoxin-dependent thiol peroxidase [Propionibacteriaceae bacterium]
MSRLEAGEAAPAFTLPDQDGNPVSLADFARKAVVLYFYPAAMTPGCTREAVDFTSDYGKLEGAGYAVLGVSPDKPEKLARFKAKESIPFPLLSDPEHKVLEAYGAYGEKVLYGRKLEGVIRSTLVLDVAEDGSAKVRLAKYNVKATGHVGRLLEELGIA